MAQFPLLNSFRAAQPAWTTVVVLAFGLLFAPTPGQAADANGRFYTRGLGVSSCQNYLDVKSGGAAELLFFRSWVNGYLTAYNQMTASTYDIAPNANVEALAARLEDICRANPDQPFWTATFALTRSLETNRRPAAPQMVSASANGNSVTLERPAMRRVQQALKDLGYDIGTVDGLYGERTRNALEAYQQSESLPRTGIPDAATQARLLP